MSSKDRIVWVDRIEAIAIFLVLIYHSTIYSSDVIGNPSFATCFGYFFRTVLSPCVPLFFFVNGYLMLNRPLDLRAHVRKTVGYVILASVWGILTLCINMLIYGQLLSPSEFFWSFIRLKDGWTNHLWYIGALVCVYTVFPLLKTAYDHNRKVFRYFILISFILTFGNVFLNHFHTSVYYFMSGNKTFDDENFFAMYNVFNGIYGYPFVYFCLGGLADEIREKLSAFSAKKVKCAASLILLLSCLALGWMGILHSNRMGAEWDVVWNGYDTVLTLINVLCIFALVHDAEKQIPVISAVSANTLGIFLLHKPIINVTHLYLEKIPALCNVGFNLVYAAAVLFLTLAVVQIMKKIPLIRLLVNPWAHPKKAEKG